MDAVAAEGLATAFAPDEAGHQAPWGKYPDNVDDWVTELSCMSWPYDYRHWMYRHPDGRRWIGYRAGTYIRDRAIARSGMSAAVMVSESSQRITDLAGLNPGRPCDDQ
jgi:hypothetical protein